MNRPKIRIGANSEEIDMRHAVANLTNYVDYLEGLNEGLLIAINALTGKEIKELKNETDI